MSRIVLANKLKERFFVIEYFFGQNVLIGTVRLFGAPLMMLLGVWFFFSETEYSNYFGGVLIVYAIYFGFRPWLFIYTKRSLFESSLFDLKINDNQLIITEGEDVNTFDFSDFKAIEKRKEYFVIKLKTKKEIYFPKNQLNEAEISILNKRIL